MLKLSTFFSKETGIKRGSGVVRNHYISTEMYKTNYESLLGCIWVNIKGKKNHIAKSVCYRSPNQPAEIDELFTNQFDKVYRKHHSSNGGLLSILTSTARQALQHVGDQTGS
uniref:Uncharacterized protein n=1 Tax=Micrurus paraensis TaxID=1970185 RepID=A0A2D4KQ95_9SAUR